MVKNHFSVKITAPSQKVWSVLWNDTTYRQWTRAFCEGSYAVSDWKEGDKVLFLSPDGSGLSSTIMKNVHNEQMLFRHDAVMKNGEELPVDEETKKWAGALEQYTLKEQNGITELNVDLDTTEGHEKYFQDTFPKALDIVRELSEADHGA